MNIETYRDFSTWQSETSFLFFFGAEVVVPNGRDHQFVTAKNAKAAEHSHQIKHMA